MRDAASIALLEKVEGMINKDFGGEGSARKGRANARLNGNPKEAQDGRGEASQDA